MSVQPLILKMFQTDKKLEFWLDDPQINFLYTNGVVDQEVVNRSERYLKFPSPFVQKRLFHYFAHLIFEDIGQLHEPFEDLSDTITETHLNVKNLLRHYERYLRKNKTWLLKDAPRRATDLRIFEAVYHFNLYMYLSIFLRRRDGRVYPEFPTGNGKTCPDVGRISLIINYAGQTYELEVKSYADDTSYKKGIIIMPFRVNKPHAMASN